jgi:ABC-type bacteriocin/lantibiotic exporter with double-glycine peptidase domain
VKKPLSSRQRYKAFVEDYKKHRLDDIVDAAESKKAPDAPPQVEEKKSRLPWRRGNRRQYLREYLHWLRPHRRTVIVVAVLALMVAGLEMIEPLFMRYIIDKVLLNQRLDLSSRIVRLNLAGATFLSFILGKELLNVTKITASGCSTRA